MYMPIFSETNKYEVVASYVLVFLMKKKNIICIYAVIKNGKKNDLTWQDEEAKSPYILPSE
jgi:hypothetical protein